MFPVVKLALLVDGHGKSHRWSWPRAALRDSGHVDKALGGSGGFHNGLILGFRGLDLWSACEHVPTGTGYATGVWSRQGSSSQIWTHADTSSKIDMHE